MDDGACVDAVVVAQGYISTLFDHEGCLFVGYFYTRLSYTCFATLYPASCFLSCPMTLGRMLGRV
jgi:hypothetical protein